ncbi:MAG: hypothetical protein QHI48_06235 [Bacteroidota bacterium]|nr:hypothetical protein [Bacteroidota bacterium]
MNIIRRPDTDYGPELLSKVLDERYPIRITSETLRRWMIEAGLWKRARKGRRHRKKRPRRTAIGELVQFDASHHDWFEGCGPVCCLFVLIDDASNRSFLHFAPAEGKHAALEALLLCIRRYGISSALHVDRHSLYWNEEKLTRFARALRQLGCRLFYAQRTQSKGRVERASCTQQERLIKTIRPENFLTAERANAFLKGGYLDKDNQRLSDTDTMVDVHREATPYYMENIIGHEQECCFNHDMTIRLRSIFYQLLATIHQLVIPRQRVILRR